MVPIESARTFREPLLEALVSIRAHIPDDAMSAGLLGTERSGHGVRIRDDGLILTIGYVINEAEEIWIGSHDGRAVPGFVVGNDFRSGLALIRPMMPLPGQSLRIGSSDALEVGDQVWVAGSRRPSLNSSTLKLSPNRNLRGAGNTCSMKPYSPLHLTKAGPEPR